MISSETINDYLARLASRSPRRAVGLRRRFTQPKGRRWWPWWPGTPPGEKYEQHAALVARITAAADHLVDQALRLADADERPSRRSSILQTPVRHGGTQSGPCCRDPRRPRQAARTPAQLIQVAGEVVELATELFDVANPNVISDVAAAADAARAAATTARVNIDINLVAIKDGDARSALAEQTNGLEDKVVLAADSLAARVRERILA